METETYSSELEEAPLGLNGKSAEEPSIAEFDGVWCADLTPERIPFTVKGNPGWVEIRPMPERAYNDFMRLQTGGGKVSMDLKSQGQTVTLDLDQHKTQMHLVCHSLVAGKFPSGDSETYLPEGERQRVAWIEERMQSSNQKFWAWLVAHCLRVNGFTGEQAKN